MMIWDGHGWDGWVLMTFSMIVFWVLVIGAIVAVLRGFRGSGPGSPEERPGPDGRSAEQILAERYARGELEEDEYHRRADAHAGGVPKTYYLVS